MGKKRNSGSKFSLVAGLVAIFSAIGIVAYGIYKLFLKGNTANTEEESLDVEFNEVAEEEEQGEQQEIDVEAIIKKYKETMEKGLSQDVEREDLAPSDAEVEEFVQEEEGAEDTSCVK